MGTQSNPHSSHKYLYAKHERAHFNRIGNSTLKSLLHCLCVCESLWMTRVGAGEMFPTLALH